MTVIISFPPCVPFNRTPVRGLMSESIPSQLYLFFITLRCQVIFFPEREFVAFRVLTDGEVAHLWHGCL